MVADKILLENLPSYEIGFEKGIEFGKEEGKTEGIKLGKLSAAKELLDILDDEVIAKKLGLSLEEVKELRKR